MSGKKQKRPKHYYVECPDCRKIGGNEGQKCQYCGKTLVWSDWHEKQKEIAFRRNLLGHDSVDSDGKIIAKKTEPKSAPSKPEKKVKVPWFAAGIALSQLQDARARANAKEREEQKKQK